MVWLYSPSLRTGGVGTSGDHQLELLALECVASTVGPACGDYLVLPFLEQRGGGVPVERELEDYAVGGLQ